MARTSSSRRARAAAVASVASVAATLAAGAAAPAAGAAPRASAAGVTVTLRWTRTFSCGSPSQTTCGVSQSSPTLATLDGRPDVLVGGQDGVLHAMHTSDGSDVAGWGDVATGSPIESSPAVDPANGEVFVGAGSAAAGYGSHGGYFSFAANGAQRWAQDPTDKVGYPARIVSSPSIGDINGDGVPDVTATNLGLDGWSYTVDGGLNPGWPREQTDTSFSTPAQVSIDDPNDLVVGGDSSPGGLINNQGGVVQGLNGSGGVLWTHLFNDTVDSSPAVTQVGGATRVAIGVGDFVSASTRSLRSDATTSNVFDTHGNVVARYQADAYTDSSPTWADVTGAGHPELIQPTWGGSGQDLLTNVCKTGDVSAWDPTTGAELPGFPLTQADLPDLAGTDLLSARGGCGGGGGGGTLGQAVTADVNGDGVSDLIIAGGDGADVYDARDHVLLARLNPDNGGPNGAYFLNSPLVVGNGDGSVDVIIAGQQSQAHGYAGLVADYTLRPTAGAASVRPSDWPQFGHDARHTGSALAPPLTYSACTASTTPGYWEFAADGGVFAQCSPFYGSIGGHPLNQPVVGGAATPAGDGYWEVASDGGIFAFGGAHFQGSMGGHPLNRPIVAMAPTRDGGGYWLVASDGGIFAFGDARFEGSMGGQHLNQPIVGMAATPDGGGYWLVASDGGIFAFGDARFEGSMGGQHLNQPIVGMAPAPGGSGYWLVASDGGIFAFNAPFHGSTGGIHLNRPVVGMAATKDGSGYWLVASDGGIFAFNAPFSGSTGSLRLVEPVVGMAGDR